MFSSSIKSRAISELSHRLQSTYHTGGKVLSTRRLPIVKANYSSTSVNETEQLRRSYLYVPCSSERMLQKSLTSNAETFVYDLEDSIAPSGQDKSSARSRLEDFLDSASLPNPARIAVRLNDWTTPFFEHDLSLVLKLPTVRTLVLPKVHSTDYLDRVAQAIAASPASSDNPIRIVASIESAKSLWNIGSIASWKDASAKSILTALLFAAEDYCADTSVVRTPSRLELLYTRSQIVAAAKAFGLEAIDMVCVNYKDAEYLKEECEDGRRLGFTGKQAIHPAQLDVIHATFVPSDNEILRAAKIVHTMTQAHASARGAAGLDIGDGRAGKEMIDAPMLKQAENTLRIARSAGLPIPNID